MAPKTKRYELILYRHQMKRWYNATFFLGIVLLAFGSYFYFFVEDILISDLGSSTLWGLGAFSLLISVFLFLLRRGSYVRVYPTYFQIVTPFMRVKVPFKSITRTQTLELRTALASKKLKGQSADIIVPFANKTVIVVSLTKFPFSPGLLHAFMSPFFFADKTPHFILLVDDWLGFSTELESQRAGAKQYRSAQIQQPYVSQEVSKPKAKPQAKPQPKPKPQAAPPQQKKSGSGILSSLKGDDKK